MSAWRARIAALLVAGGFAYGLLRLFGMQFAPGDVYPEYSSLRSDPLGARLLFDSLARLPGMTVARNYFPLQFVEENGATVLLLALNPEAFTAAEPNLQTMERLAGRGNRVVAAMNAEPLDHAPRAGALESRWHVRFGFDSNKRHARHLYFVEANGWRVLDHVGEKLLAIERGFGQGSVVLFSESGDFNNESTAAADRLDVVAGAIGDYSRVIFDEQHLGIAESGSVVGLARRFRLNGLAFGLALCAALFLWKNAARFPPPARARPVERLAGRTSLSGLLTLLRRNVPPPELAAACWQEWLAGNRRDVSPERVRRADEIVRNRAAGPLEAAREIQAVLTQRPLPDGRGSVHAKGEL